MTALSSIRERLEADERCEQTIDADDVIDRRALLAMVDELVKQRDMLMLIYTHIDEGNVRISEADDSFWDAVRAFATWEKGR
jgi:hypothetical protein